MRYLVLIQWSRHHDLDRSSPTAMFYLNNQFIEEIFGYNLLDRGQITIGYSHLMQFAKLLAYEFILIPSYCLVRSDSMSYKASITIKLK